jgi:hypothetical protein
MRDGLYLNTNVGDGTYIFDDIEIARSISLFDLQSSVDCQ